MNPDGIAAELLGNQRCLALLPQVLVRLPEDGVAVYELTLSFVSLVAGLINLSALVKVLCLYGERRKPRISVRSPAPTSVHARALSVTTTVTKITNTAK